MGLSASLESRCRRSLSPGSAVGSRRSESFYCLKADLAREELRGGCELNPFLWGIREDICFIYIFLIFFTDVALGYNYRRANDNLLRIVNFTGNVVGAIM